jgi:cytochrome c-type biogenesis protein CcmH
MRRENKLGVFLLVAIFAANPVWAQSTPTIQEIKTSLICLCDCNMTVEACEGAMACESADKLTAEAQQLIDKGLDKKAVLASFVSRYGEHILSAPTKKGFNLAAWITPFVAILVAGFVIVQFVRKWSRQQEKPKHRLKKQRKKNSDPRYENMLDEVLKGLD